jgi:hypothetical protein
LHTFRTFVVAGGILIGWSPLVAQDPAPPQTLTIQIGEAVTNFLSTSDDTLQDGSRYKTYLLSGQAGDSITVAMSSRDFNTLVMLADPADSVLTSDSNGGGRCNAHLTFVLPQDGTYSLIANGEWRAEIGEFQLRVLPGIEPPSSRTPCRGFVNPEGIVAVGDSVVGTVDENDRQLADSSSFEVWVLSGTAGTPFTVDLVSTDFDARLILVRGFDEVLSANDDGGIGCNARIAATVNDMRPLRVVVIAPPARKAGSYTLRVAQGEQPTRDGDACEPPGGGPDADGA